MSTVPADLDRRFREAAAAEGLVDVAYELHDSPVGQLLVAATERGLCRISYSPELELERIAHAFGPRVLRVPAAATEARRQLDEYFDQQRTDFDPLGGFTGFRGDRFGLPAARARHGFIPASAERVCRGLLHTRFEPLLLLR